MTAPHTPRSPMLARALVVSCAALGVVRGDDFRRGDVDGDSSVDVADVVRLLDFFGPTGALLPCQDAADVDDDGALDIVDLVLLQQLIIQPGVVLAPPGPALCGPDPTPDGLECAQYRACDPDPPVPTDVARYDFDAPATIEAPAGETVRFEVFALLSNRRPLRAWSQSVRSSCPVVAVGFEGTGIDAFVTDGFAHAEMVGDGILAAVVLGSSSSAQLPTAAVRRVLRFEVETNVDAGCRPCALAFDDDTAPARSTRNRIAPLADDSKAETDGVGLPIVTPYAVDICPPVEILEPGADIEVELTPGEVSRSFVVPPIPFGAPAVFTIEATGEAPVALYARHARRAGPAAFERAADRRGATSQRLVIAHDRSAPLYIELRSTRSSGAASFDLAISQAGIAIESATPERDGDGELRVLVRGAGLGPETVFRLENRDDGSSSLGVVRRVVSDEWREVEFATTPGTWDVVVDAGGLLDRSPRPIEIVPRADAQPLVSARLVAPPRLRIGRVRRLSLHYGNEGGRSMPAPLLRVVGPADAELRVAGDASFTMGSVDVLATGPGGHPDILAAGASAVATIEVRLHSTGEAEFDVRRLDDSAFGTSIDWLSIPSPGGVADDDWILGRPSLAAELGATLGDYRAALARRAFDCRPRGDIGRSVVRLFRDAWAEVSGRPVRSIVGRLRDPLGLPIDGAVVVATPVGFPAAAAAAVTDVDGRFALDRLEDAVAHAIAVVDHDVGPILATPLGGDVLGFELVGVRGLAAPRPGCAACDDTGLPKTALPLPDAVFRHLSTSRATGIASRDPNTKEGPAGTGDDVLVDPEDELEYSIQFENLETETAPARRVLIEDELDAAFDLATFRFRDVGFGDTIVSLDAVGQDLYGGYSFDPGFERWVAREEVLVPTPSGDVIVVIDAVLDVLARRARWTFQTLDPRTRLEPTDEEAGFLPPNVGRTGAGEGWVRFSVGLATSEEGAEVENDAIIQFDTREPIRTDSVRHVVSLFLPEEATAPVPVAGGVAPPRPLLAWAPTANAETWDATLWRDGEPRPARPNVAGLAEPRWHVDGPLEIGVTYRWRIDALNARGRWTVGPEWAFVVARAFVRGDVTADGAVDLTDPVVLLDYLFRGGREPACLEAIDVDRSGVLDITDPIALLLWLFGGGRPPAEPSPGETSYAPEDCDVDGEATFGCAAFAPCG